jgi:SAM-dependent methyltransferase
MQEFAALRAGSLTRYSAAMGQYKERLMAAVDVNDTAIVAMCGSPDNSLAARAQLLWQSDSDTYDGLGSLWRHLAKDWTSEGAVAQHALREKILQAVLREEEGMASSSAEVLRVLVPGCGQARLAYTLAQSLRGGKVTALERSEGTLAFARHMLRAADGEAEHLTFHPFLDAFSNNLDASGRAAGFTTALPVASPLNQTLTPSLSLEAGDFLDGTPRQRSHVVVTAFLLDCVDDIADGVRAVRRNLVPGGLWVFAGPLHYHQGGAYTPRPHPTLTELQSLATDLGFALQETPELIAAPYVRRPSALINEADWVVPCFSARLEHGL